MASRHVRGSLSRFLRRKPQPSSNYSKPNTFHDNYFNAKASKPTKSVTAEHTDKRVTVPSKRLSPEAFAKLLRVKASVITNLTDSSYLDLEEMELVGLEMGYDVTYANNLDNNGTTNSSRREKQQNSINKTDVMRPVVSIMGHVDHGKTQLLDVLRSRANKKSVSTKEAGGITQGISAFTLQNSTILDTPGHSAFVAQQRCASNVASLVLCVIDVKQGIASGTIEILSQLKQSAVDVVIVLTKIDLISQRELEGRRMEIMARLTEYDVLCEDLGGDVPCLNVSAVSGAGIPELLDFLSAIPSTTSFPANTDTSSDDSSLLLNFGPPAASLLNRTHHKSAGSQLFVIPKARINAGDWCVISSSTNKLSYTKVKALSCPETGKRIKSHSLAQPLQLLVGDIMGSGDLAGGDEIYLAKSQEECKALIAQSETDELVNDLTSSEDESDAVVEEGSQESFLTIPLILKADSSATLSALQQSISQINEFYSDQFHLNEIYSAVGSHLTPAELSLAESNSEILTFTFNVSCKNAGANIRNHSIIYSLLDDLSALVSDQLPPIEDTNVIGRGVVKDTFYNGKVAGIQVSDKRFVFDKKYRLVRQKQIIEQDLKCSALKRFKDDVTMVKQGDECGLELQNYSGDYIVGDVLECYEILQKKPQLNFHL